MAALSSLYSRFGAAFIGLLSGGALSRSVRPIFELVEQEAWETSPNRLLAPGPLAELVATSLTDVGDVRDEAQRQGFTENRLRALIQLALTTPTIGQAMEARRRKKITDDQYRHVLRKAGIEPQYDPAMFALLEVLPPATDLIRFAVREVFTPELRRELELDLGYPDAITARGAQLGFDEGTMRDYWAAHWQLPSYEQGAEMLFRKAIDPDDFPRLLRALDYSPKWRKPLEEIAKRIPTVPDMVRFAVREVYNPPLRKALGYEAEYPVDFTDEAAKHGLSETYAKQYWWAHWRLPSARQGYQMLWRKEIDKAELFQLLKALDYPLLWRQRLLNIAYLKPGRIDLKRLLRHGIYTRAQVKEGYQAIGYNVDDAESLTQIAEAEQATSATANPFLTSARRQLYTVTHTEYLDDSIDAATARANLSTLGVTVGDQTTILALWDAENAIRRRELTTAQIRKAFRRSLITRDDAIDRLTDAGLTLADAGIFLESG